MGRLPLTFRAFDPDRDYPSLVELWNLDNSDQPTSEQWLRSDDRAHSGYRFERFMGENEGNPVCAYAVGDAFWSHREGRTNAWFYLHPDWREPAFEAILDKAEEDVRRTGADELLFWAREDRPLYGRMLEERGFQVVQRLPVIRLTLSEHEPERWAPDIRRVEENGIRLCDFCELEREGYDWMLPLYDAHWEMAQDIPSRQEATRRSFEAHCEHFADKELTPREWMFAAMDGDRLVAFTRLEPWPGNPGLLLTTFTGTVRSHRRRGIVTALKAHSLNVAKEREIREVQTDNLENNPMREINLRLGFRDTFCWLQYERRFIPDPAA
jgi:GNAT superfamily N-acetyltransferase